MKIAIVASTGGHLSELLRLGEVFEGHEVFVMTNDYGRHVCPRQYGLPVPPFTAWRVARCCWMILRLLWSHKPDVLISTGAEIAIPAFFFARFLRIRTIFIETVTRFETPTLSGRACYRMSDLFLVQQPQMLKHYGPRARYEGRVL